MQLENFTRDEFQGWWDRLDPKLLARLDVLRFRWGAPINISPANGGVGRESGSSSQHDYRTHGVVRAVDTFPDELFIFEEAVRFVRLATECGFTGIGIYPDWQPSCGVHLDTRPDNRMGEPALWGAMDNDDGVQGYITYDHALQLLPE